MPTQAPHENVFQAQVVARAATADGNTDVVEAPEAAIVTAVEYIPIATLTGANTNSRTVTLVNKKADGTGTVAVATLAFTSGVNATADVSKTIPLADITVTGHAADLSVATGDVLQWQSAHVGSSGLADPGGQVRITLDRS